MRPSLPLCFIAAVLAASWAHAQSDRRAGLFTQARQLPLVSQTVRVTARAGAAEVIIEQLFLNDGPDLGQADYQLHLPEQAQVTSFAFWRGDRRIAAELKEKSEAERAHDAAAREGRSTALLKTDAGVQRFSVFPVKANEYQRVELTVRVPVAREMGRSAVALAMDRFLARGRATAAVLVDVHTEGTLSDVGVAGARARVVARRERHAQLAFSTEQPVEVWWTEKGPPLAIDASSVALPGGGRAVGLRIVLNDAGAWRAPYRRVHLFIDGSFSMRSRRAAVVEAVQRLRDQSAAEVHLWAVGERTHPVPVRGDAASLVAAALSGGAGFTARAQAFLAAFERARCDDPEVRCVAVSDLSLPGVETLGEQATRFLFFADAHERAATADKVPPDVAVFLPEVEGPARLRALADEKVLPVLEVKAVTQGGKALEPIRPTSSKVAEGGLLRLFYEGEGAGPLKVTGVVDGGAPLNLDVVVTPREAESPEGKALRFGFWERKLADWMAAYRKSPDPDLKKMIVEASLREGIPTAFTALQAASPELSLHDIKPGDPLLSVAREPGLEEVVAWYPFGEVRALARDGGGGPFTDRFLVPRGWEEKSYAVEVFKRYEDGTVRQERVWYVLDDSGPRIAVVDAGEHHLALVQMDAEGDVSSVRVEARGMAPRTLSPLNGRWLIEKEGLPGKFRVVARDRAGNTAHLEVGGGGRAAARGHPRAEATTVPVRWSVDEHLALEGGVVTVRLGEETFSYASKDAPLASARMTAALRLKDGLVFGTSRGDLVRLRCVAGGPCSARQLGEAFLEHPITGLATLAGGRVLVGVLGLGLHEMGGEGVTKSRLDVGSSYISAVTTVGGEVLVGTAYNGLWRIVGGRAVRERFPSKHVTALQRAGRRVEVISGPMRFVRLGRDRFGTPSQKTFDAGSPGLMAAARFEGELFLGAFDAGLFRWDGARAVAVPLELSPMERQVNALATFAGALWMATEGGVLRVTRAPRGGWEVQRVSDAPAQDLSAGRRTLAVATGHGLLLVDSGGAVRAFGAQGGEDLRRLFAVRWVGEVLYAGGMEGLYRIDGERVRRLGVDAGFDSGWVTALEERAGVLYVGTYDRGVYAVRNEFAAPVPGLSRQWVPLRSLANVGGALWVGGLGMPAARLDETGVQKLALPVRDTNGFVKVEGGVLALTNDGALLLSEPVPTAAR